MSLKKVNKPETNVVEIEFTIPQADFEAEVNNVYKKKAASITVPGFRKGKAPKHIFEKFYGKGAFYEDALNNLIPSAYEDAIKDEKFEAVSQPEFDVVSVGEGDVELKAKFYVKPDVEINDYKGIEVTKTVREATEDEVNAEVEQTRSRNARQVEITDREAHMGDVVVFDFDGYVDGKQFEGGKAEKYSLALGSGQFIPGFEEQIVGKNIGDEFDVEVTFPKDYHAEELAGKPATFKCKLHEIKFNELPELDDEFAKDVSEFDTLDEYKADVKAKINEKYNKNADAEVEEQIIDSLIDKMDADIPQPMYDAETENFVRDFDSRLRMQGLDLKTYFQYTGLNLDSLREQMKPQAMRQVKTRLALEKIALLEKIEVAEAEIDEEIARIAENYKMEAEEVKKYVSEAMIKADLSVKKAVELVKGAAKVTEKAYEEPKAEEPVAEKPKRKPRTTKKAVAEGEATDAEAPKKTSTRKKKTEAAEGEEKPAPKKRATKKTSEAADDASTGDAQ